MCGIVGFVGEQSEELKRSTLLPMLRAIVHRGPDDEGVYTDASVALGFRRLAIIDLVSGRQPLANEDETVWTVFNGEIYNFAALRSQLESHGHVFRSKSDTEVIVHAYEQWGDEFVQRLNGMFGLAVWDTRRKRLLLAVDRAGIKPLYYAIVGDTLVFASEAKSILKSGLIPVEPDYHTLPFHMAFLTSPFPRTMFRHVQKLSPGYVATYEAGQLRRRQYWDLDPMVDYQQWSDHPYEKIANDIHQATRNQMIADVPLGGFLSGGIDSSAICHFLTEERKEPIETYFIKFRSEDMANDILMDESPFADKMAKELNSIHHSIYATTDDLEALLPKLAWHLDEPVGDPAGLTTYLVSQQARQTLTVLLSGAGGDEIFGGYPRYLAMALLQKYRRVPSVLRRGVGAAAQLIPSGKLAVLRNLRKFTKAASQDPSHAYLDMLTYFGPEDQKKLFTPEFYDEYCQEDVYRYHREIYNTSKLNDQPLLTRLQYLDFKTFLPCLNLTYTDRMSMAASIEVRVPYLDDQLVASIATLPAKEKLCGRVRKYGMKRSMEGRLPDSVIYRRKTGFGSPIHAWLRGRLRPLVDHYLGESYLREQGIFNSEFVAGILRAEWNNRVYYSNHIWELLTFQLWHQVFVKDSPNLGEGLSLAPATLLANR